MQATNSISNYVGITGVLTARQADAVIDAAAAHGFDSSHDRNLMLGGLVNPGTALGLPAVYTRKPHRHIAFDELAEFLQLCVSRDVIGMVHFELAKPAFPLSVGCELDESDPYHVVTLVRQLERAGVKIPGGVPIQLNGVLTPTAFKRIVDATGARLVLQFRSQLLQAPEALVLTYIEELVGLAQTILFDGSAGAGTAIDSRSTIGWHLLIEKNFPGAFSFGYAGGLGPQSARGRQGTLDGVRAISAELMGHGIQAGEIKWDVETGVRTPGSDDLSVDSCDHYLEDMAKALNSQV